MTPKMTASGARNGRLSTLRIAVTSLPSLSTPFTLRQYGSKTLSCETHSQEVRPELGSSSSRTVSLAYSLNQGSSRICLADALADGSKYNKLPMISPSLVISSLVRSGVRRPSKYTSSSHSCRLGSELPAVTSSPLSIASHIFCHLLGRSSLAISCI